MEPHIHLTATECHLPYGITQCYLPPDCVHQEIIRKTATRASALTQTMGAYRLYGRAVFSGVGELLVLNVHTFWPSL